MKKYRQNQPKGIFFISKKLKKNRIKFIVEHVCEYLQAIETAVRCVQLI